MPAKKIAHYIRGAAGRGDEGTKTGPLLHFWCRSATEIAGDCAQNFAPRSLARVSLCVGGENMGPHTIRIPMIDRAHVNHVFNVRQGPLNLRELLVKQYGLER